MHKMTTYERFSRTFAHRETDRIPIVDSPWAGTILRWEKEGMPKGMDWRDYFDVDKMERIAVDTSPRYEHKILEETDRYIIETTPWGVTMKNFKVPDSTPEFLDFKVSDMLTWQDAKKRMTFSEDRIGWQELQKNYPLWRKNDSWIQGLFWFGFDVTHSWMAGTETILIALLEEPDWVSDMFNHYLDMAIWHFDRLWNAGYPIDSMFWYDDMGYKNTTFFSVPLYREVLKPVHKRAVEWAHNHGIPAHLHSCGYIMPLLPELAEIGVDALNPLEVKAGMDVLKIKEDYGSRMVLHGGINAVLWDKKEDILEEMEHLVPLLKKDGGYIFSSDHSVPHSVSLENFREIIEKAKELGRF